MKKVDKRLKAYARSTEDALRIADECALKWRVWYKIFEETYRDGGHEKLVRDVLIWPQPLKAFLRHLVLDGFCGRRVVPTKWHYSETVEQKFAHILTMLIRRMDRYAFTPLQCLNIDEALREVCVTPVEFSVLKWAYRIGDFSDGDFLTGRGPCPRIEIDVLPKVGQVLENLRTRSGDLLLAETIGCFWHDAQYSPILMIYEASMTALRYAVDNTGMGCGVIGERDRLNRRLWRSVDSLGLTEKCVQELHGAGIVHTWEILAREMHTLKLLLSESSLQMVDAALFGSDLSFRTVVAEFPPSQPETHKDRITRLARQYFPDVLVASQ